MRGVGKPMHSYCSCVPMLVRDSELSCYPSNLTDMMCVANLSTASLRCSSKFNTNNCNVTILSNSRLLGDSKSEQCSFLLVISDSCKLSLNSRVVHSTNSLRFQREVEKQMWNWKLPTWGDVYESGYKTHCLALSSRSHNLSEIQAIMGHSCCQGRKCTWGMQ